MQNKNIRVPYGLSVHGNDEIKAVNKVFYVYIFYFIYILMRIVKNNYFNF